MARSAEAIVFGLASAAHSQHSAQPFPRPAVIFGTQAGQIELAPPSPPMCRCLHALERGRGVGKCGSRRTSPWRAHESAVVWPRVKAEKSRYGSPSVVDFM